MSRIDEQQREEYRKSQQRKKRRANGTVNPEKQSVSKKRPTETANKKPSGKRPVDRERRKSSEQQPPTNRTRKPRPSANRSTRDELNYSDGKAMNASKKAQGRERIKQREERNNRISRNVGIGIAIAQAVASILFLVGLFMLDMLPTSYLMIILVLLLLFDGIILASQLLSKKNAITGKILGGFITVILLIGAYFLFKTTGALSDITGSDYKLDNVVVAVLAEDSAESLEDVADYTFGVQYQMGGEQIETTVEAINEELGSEIQVVEYSSLSEQATALHDGEVDAIIYNEGYTGILQEAFEGYSSNTKVIYNYEIKSEVDLKASDVSVKDETFSVYISGIDVYGPIETNSRSDVNIIATVNPTTHQVLLTTTPRDYYVEFPGVTGGQKDKLTHAGIYGVDVSMNTLGNLYDTEIDFYARVNFTSLIQIVDALGGIDVYSEYAFTTSADTEYSMTVVEGMNHFNGKEALAFCRERQNIPGGDNQRGKNQQAVITAIIQKMISPAILVGANDLIASVSGNVDTNMTMDQIQDLIKQQLKDGASWDIKSVAADGTGDSQYCYSYAGGPLYVTQPNQETVKMIKDAIDAVEAGEMQEGAVATE